MASAKRCRADRCKPPLSSTFALFKQMKRRFQNKRSLSDNAWLEDQGIEQGGSRVSCTVVCRSAATAVLRNDHANLPELLDGRDRLGLRTPAHGDRHDPGGRCGDRSQTSFGILPALCR